MNGIILPQLKHEYVLRRGMVTAINDMAHDFPVFFLDGYGNGIIKGCHITAEPGKLTVGKGMIYYNGEICYIREPITVEYEPTDVYHTVKLRFKESVVKEGCSCRLVDVVNFAGTTVMDNEVELCRFKLKNGSKLRSKYVDFEDYNTEYDTVNIISVPYACAGGTTLNPMLVKAFAAEAMKYNMNMVDQSFCIRAMDISSPVARESIIAYAAARAEMPMKEYSNMEIFDMLNSVLDILRDSGERTVRSAKSGRKAVLL